MNQWHAIDTLLRELILGQKKQLLLCGRRFVPSLTPEDMLQPNDYAELENNPRFRYEEGILAGLQMAEMALRAQHCDITDARGSCTFQTPSKKR